MIFDWKHINLTEFLEAKTFAGGLLRGSVEYNETDHVTLTDDGYLNFKIDYERNKLKPVPSYRVEFTESPWMKRFTTGTLDVYRWKYRFPANYKKALTPVSIFQMYCRWAEGGAVMCQLELARTGQLKTAFAGQVQMIYNAGPTKYRELTPFIPESGDELNIEVTCKHGIDGYLKVVINGLTVFDRLCNTVFLDNPEANAQAKWGIYHHGLKDIVGPANNQLHIDAGHKTFELEMSPLEIQRTIPGEIIIKPINEMRHITSDTLQKDNETFRNLLEPNGWKMSDGDFLFSGFIKETKNVGTTTADNLMPQLREGSTIWVLPDAIRGVESLVLSNGTLKVPWKVKHVKVRIIPTEKLIIKGNPSSSYSPLRLYGPQRFDIDLRSVQFPAKNLSNPNEIPLHVDTEGIKKNMTIHISADGFTPHVIFNGWSAGGGSFAGLRMFDAARFAKVSGEIQDFVITNTISEGAYIGSIQPMHAVFTNFLIRNGLVMNAGAEFLQLLNFGEGSLIENISMVNSGVEYPSSFQNYQRGALQIKAGGGSFKVRNIFAMGYGSPGIGLFSAGPYKDPVSGETFGVKPGDKIEFSNIFYTHGAGPLLQVDKSNVHGAEWIFDNVHVGGATKRMGLDTGLDIPYAFLNDVFTATDKVIFKSITTDKSLPLVGKTGKYTIEKHNVVDKVTAPKFVNAPFAVGDHVIAYYHKYNEESQLQFYPVAGQPVKYKKGDIAYKDTLGGKRTWWRALRDVEGSAGGPGDGWEPIETPQPNSTQAKDSPLLGIAGYDQGVQPTEPLPDKTIEQLKLENMALSEEIKSLAAKAEALESELQSKTEENAALQQKQAQIVSSVEAAQGAISQAITNLLKTLQ